jgi:hypothetical protein
MVKKAFTVLEVIFTILAITSLSGVMYEVTRPIEKIDQANQIRDEMVANALERAIQIYIADHGTREGLIPNTYVTGYYHICNQQIPNCPKDGKHIDLDILVTEEYLKLVPELSTNLDETTTGFILRYKKGSDTVIILTYEEWEGLGKP